MKTLIPTALACALMLIPLRAEGQTADSGQQPEFSGVSTRYFGPYAFPVPDLLDGRIHDGLHVELSGDAVAGRAGGRENRDWTFAPTFRLSVPLWTDRASFTIWGEFHEFYFDTPATRAARNLAPGALPLKGNDSGNLYFGIEIQALKERRLVPSVAVRASTLSATTCHAKSGQACHLPRTRAWTLTVNVWPFSAASRDFQASRGNIALWPRDRRQRLS